MPRRPEATTASEARDPWGFTAGHMCRCRADHMAALSANCDGVHFDCSHVYASGNLAADMYASIAAKHRRQLAVRLFDARRSRACGKMLSILLAPDPMHQQQPLAAIEDIGGRAALP